MARDKAPKGAQGGQKPSTSKAGSYQFRDSKTSGKSLFQATGPTKPGTKGIVASGLERQISVRLLSAKDPRPADVVARVELRRMVDQIPAEKLQPAIEALKAIITPGRTDSPVVAATDAEVMAATDQFISQYKPALDRLAKR